VHVLLLQLIKITRSKQETKFKKIEAGHRNCLLNFLLLNFISSLLQLLVILAFILQEHLSLLDVYTAESALGSCVSV